MTDTQACTTVTVVHKRGRPKNDPVDAFRVKTWFVAVREKSGLKTAYQLDKRFAPEKFRRGLDGECIRPCQWDKYERGENVPKDPLVALVETSCPGTRQWLVASLWKVIRARTLPISELHFIIATIRPTLASLSHATNPASRVRRKPNDLSRIGAIDSLWRQGDVEAMTALLGLVLDAEQRSSDHQHAEAALAALHLFILLAANDPLHSVRHELFTYLKDRFFTRVYPMGLTLGVNLFDLDDAIDSMRRAVTLFNEYGIPVATPRDRGRISYWMWRLGMVEIGIAYPGLLNKPLSVEDIMRAQVYVRRMKKQLSISERRHPRSRGWLEKALLSMRLSCLLLKTEPKNIPW